MSTPVHSRAPAHQNSFAFKHNKNSKKTKKIASIPNVGVCKRCHDIIEWRKKYRKYKPLTKAGKCHECHQYKITSAYHSLCKDCSNTKEVCPKCCKHKDIWGKDEEEMEEMIEEIEYLRDNKGAIAGITERERRTLIRNLTREVKGTSGASTAGPRDTADKDAEDDDDADSDGSGEDAAAGTGKAATLRAERHSESAGAGAAAAASHACATATSGAEPRTRTRPSADGEEDTDSDLDEADIDAAASAATGAGAGSSAAARVAAGETAALDGDFVKAMRESDEVGAVLTRALKAAKRRMEGGR